MCISNNRPSKYMKQILTELKSYVDKFQSVVRYVDILSVIEEENKEKIIKNCRPKEQHD